jgi:hypothetical protein
MLDQFLEYNIMGNENNNIGYCLTNRESKQEILGRISESVKHVKQIGHAFPEKIISDIRFWLNENIDCFEKFSESEKIKLMDDVAQLKLTIFIVEEWFENQIRRDAKLKDERKESEINPTNPSTFKS